MSFLDGLRRRMSGLSESERSQSPGQNVTFFQGFEWYVPADHKHWKRLREVMPDLKQIGIDHLWLPPGEFDWKMSKSTKWGPREDLEELGAKASEMDMSFYWDAVLNHKAAADRKETCKAVSVDPQNRLKDLGSAKDIEAWVCFDFPARGERYSPQKYCSKHFTGTDYNATDGSNGIFRFSGPGMGWARDVDDENGNADYLMFSDVNYNNPEVRADVCNWGRWIGEQIPLKGMRVDAIRHISEGFLRQFMQHVRDAHGSDQFFIGEYWKNDLPSLRNYLRRMSHCLSLFDAPLVHKFAHASRTPNYDLRKIFERTLVSVDPQHAITLVMNHDTQPTQALAEGAAVAPRFSHLAHALVLLRQAGTPCLFYGTLYGTQGPEARPPDPLVADICLARKLYAYGRQRDYFSSANCIGWTREGHIDWSGGSGLAVLVANYETKGSGRKGSGSGSTTLVRTRRKMQVGRIHCGEVWTNLLQPDATEATIDAQGWGSFTCPQYGISVWTSRDAPGREMFGKLCATFDASKCQVANKYSNTDIYRRHLKD